MSIADPGLRRPLLHMAMGGFALLLRWLTPVQAASAAAAALLFNLFVLHRLTRGSLLRPGERPGSFASGIVLYPVAVLALVLVFRGSLHVAAAAWGLLAFGDGMAAVAGRVVGGARLPWNAGKTWAGLVAFVAFGASAALFLVQWTRPGAVPDAGLLVAACLAAGLAAGLAESLPSGLDDNVLVPLVGGGVLYAALLVQPALLAAARESMMRGAAIGLGVNLVLAAAAWWARSVRLSGVVAGVALGTALYSFAGARGFALLLLFFVLGSAATRAGFARKAALGLAQSRGGRRGAAEACANVTAGLGFAFLALATSEPGLFRAAMVAAFATAAADTVSSEIGQAFGRRHYLSSTFRRVPAGTDGAVSLEGTLAGILAACLVAGAGGALDLVGLGGALVVVAAAFFGSYFESLLGATLEQKLGIGNEGVNFANTVAGGLFAIALLRGLRLG